MSNLEYFVIYCLFVGSQLLSAGYSRVRVNAEELLREYGSDTYNNVTDSSDTYPEIYVVGKQKINNISRYTS